MNSNIKFFTFSNNNAPQIQNAYGSIISVLDACLVSGIQIGSISSIIINDDVATAHFLAPHNLKQYQKISINGADQLDFNNEYMITKVVDSTKVQFKVKESLGSLITGAISATLSSLGWEKPFYQSSSEGGGKAAYRSSNKLSPSRPFLRVVDERDSAYNSTYAKYAKVGIVEEMINIDDLQGVQAPYDPINPQKNWASSGAGASVINGWARWYYATSYGLKSQDADRFPASSNNMKWLLVGNEDWFYLINSANEDFNYSAVYGFGLFESFIDGDSSNNFLISSLSYHDASSNVFRLSGCPIPILNNRSLLLQRDYLQEKSTTAAIVSIGIGSITNTSGVAATGVGDAQSVGYALMPAYIHESNIRGALPALKWLYQPTPFSDQQVFVMGSEIFMAKNIAKPSSDNYGQIVLKIGDLL